MDIAATNEYNILGKQDTLCWHCAKAIKKCPWSKNFKPVKGWDAIPTKIRIGYNEDVDSFFVRDCPLFEADSKSAHKLWEQEKHPPVELRQAISLYKAGKSYDEIAKRLGKTKKEVRTMLYRWYDE